MILDQLPIDGSLWEVDYSSIEEEKEWEIALRILKAYGYIYLQESEERIEYLAYFNLS